VVWDRGHVKNNVVYNDNVTWHNLVTVAWFVLCPYRQIAEQVLLPLALEREPPYLTETCRCTGYDAMKRCKFSRTFWMGISTSIFRFGRTHCRHLPWKLVGGGGGGRFTFHRNARSFFHRTVESAPFIKNVGKFLPDYTASHWED
jgi:hypothetical protein